MFFEILPGSSVQQIHQPRVARLVETVDSFANEQMNIQLSAQVAQFSPRLAVHNRFADAQGSTKTGDNPSDGRNFDVACGVAHQIYFAARETAAHRNPFRINRNSGRLVLQRFEVVLFQESLERPASLRAFFADQSEDSTGRGIRDEPVKVGSIVGDEPHSCRIGRHVFWQANHRLHQRHSCLRRPACNPGYATHSAISGHQCFHARLLSCIVAILQLQVQTSSRWLHRHKPVTERYLGSARLRGGSQVAKQLATFNYQIRISEADAGRASIGKEFESADLIYQRTLSNIG